MLFTQECRSSFSPAFIMTRVRRPFLISRRRFLQASTVVAGVTSVSPLSSQDVRGQKAETLPASIASLKSRRDEAKPVSIEERAQRQQRARVLMREEQIDAILLTQGTSLIYFAGIQWWGGERLFTMVLPAKGDAFFVSPAFEEGRAREQISKGPNGANPDLRIWQEDENPYDRVAQGLKDRGLGTSKLGIEETVKFVFSQGIAAASPQAQIQTATPITAGCRMHQWESTRVLLKILDRIVPSNIHPAQVHFHLHQVRIGLLE